MENSWESARAIQWLPCLPKASRPKITRLFSDSCFIVFFIHTRKVMLLQSFRLSWSLNHRLSFEELVFPVCTYTVSCFIHSHVILNSLLNLLFLPSSWVYSFLHPKFIILKYIYTSRILQSQVYYLKPFSRFPLSMS